MMILIDTSVWSLAFRRSSRSSVSPLAVELTKLIRDGRAAIIGPIRQEILSGVKDRWQFDLLKSRLRAFPDMALDSGDYEAAAEFSNTCRARGIQGSSIDFLICAVTARRNLSIFTTDGDFTHFAAVLSIHLHSSSESRG